MVIVENPAGGRPECQRPLTFGNVIGYLDVSSVDYALHMDGPVILDPIYLLQLLCSAYAIAGIFDAITVRIMMA
jgi:hypothetical protein